MSWAYLFIIRRLERCIYIPFSKARQKCVRTKLFLSWKWRVNLIDSEENWSDL